MVPILVMYSSVQFADDCVDTMDVNDGCSACAENDNFAHCKSTRRQQSRGVRHWHRSNISKYRASADTNMILTRFHSSRCIIKLLHLAKFYHDLFPVSVVCFTLPKHPQNHLRMLCSKFFVYLTSSCLSSSVCSAGYRTLPALLLTPPWPLGMNVRTPTMSQDATAEQCKGALAQDL